MTSYRLPEGDKLFSNMVPPKLNKVLHSFTKYLTKNNLKFYQFLRKVCVNLKKDKVTKDQFYEYLKSSTLLTHQEKLSDDELMLLVEKLSKKK